MSQNPSLKIKMFLNALDRGQNGSIRLQLPDGSDRQLGTGQTICEGKVASWSVFEGIIARGDIAFAESYIDGSFDVNRPDELIAWACENEARMRPAIYGKRIASLFDRLRHLGRKNTQTQARKNISSHYDLGNEFYGLWLDSTLTYSSALYRSPADSLEAAQAAKYERILDQLGAKQGDHILEIGCGWGGFLSHAVKHRDCKVTAITISQRQFEACQARIREEGLGQRAEVLLEDYRNIKGKYDHVVSIEMIEAVGEAYWAEYFAKVRSSLIGRGRAVVQAITIREDLFGRYRAGTDFIQQYIFPGGQLLTQSAFSRYGNDAGLEVVDLNAFASSYERTLREWKIRFIAARPEISRLGFGEEFFRLWELYLAYCEGAFRVGRTSVCQVTLEAVRHA